MEVRPSDVHSKTRAPASGEVKGETLPRHHSEKGALVVLFGYARRSTDLAKKNGENDPHTRAPEPRVTAYA